MGFNGLINVYKEKGYTSHDVVNILKGILKVKTGHTGTLDPQAQGVLPIVLGRSTKLADYIMAADKVYEANIHFGIRTDTQDLTGNILCDNRPAIVDMRDFTRVLEKFIGEISQIPPMYSAIKIGGEKLYNLARKGIEVERKARKVNIYSIDILEYEGESARIKVKCSKGTYIRTLCADIGEILGCGAAMGELLRTVSGDFCIEDSIKLDDVKALVLEDKIADYIIPPDETLKDYIKVYASDESRRYIKNGNKIEQKYVRCEKWEAGNKYRLYIGKERFIGLYTLEDTGFLKPEVILINLDEV
ncbi:MAG: tRNA pseudouridine(55) synthase TruB [Defluviitaleaceae bacterium]|nr:tRNA pseudouridine(55) synthase TruB [Defluviitaleaceae bacterium]